MMTGTMETGIQAYHLSNNAQMNRTSFLLLGNGANSNGTAVKPPSYPLPPCLVEGAMPWLGPQQGTIRSFRSLPSKNEGWRQGHVTLVRSQISRRWWRAQSLCLGVVEIGPADGEVQRRSGR